MPKSALIWILATVLAAAPSAAETAPPDLEKRVDRFLQPYLDIGHLSGTLLIARGDEVLYEKSFGLANHEHGVPNTARTRFCVGSINKPMTIVILARLLEAEKLALADPLVKYLPDFPRAEEITVQHLLQHTAGIPHRVTEPLDETRPQTPSSMAEMAAGKALIFEPGAQSVYSSGGFSVLARVLELAGGKPYAELLAEHVLRLAGMDDTSDAGTRAILERRASSYYFDTFGLINAPPADISHLVGSGSVFSTPRDLLAMQRALLAGRLGARAKELLVRDSGDLRWNGSAQGYRAFADYDAASGVTVVLASNLTSGAVDRIREALPKIGAGEDVPAPPPIEATAAQVDPELLRSYEGDYQLRPGTSFELRVVDGRVRLSGWLLIPISKTTFFSLQDYAEVEVVTAEDGKVTRLDWTTGGNTYPMPRVDIDAAAEDEPADLQSQVADVERAFAKTMADRDHEAFRSFLSKEAVFLSGKTARNGKEAVATHWKGFFTEPEAPFSWEPETVAVLDSGKLAISTGPVWNAAGKRTSTYTSIWRQEEPGAWRIIFDKGNKYCE
ncbi:MAG: serine hydrolase [bacterium]|nr:serine hydrolase [bacterium]